MISHPRAVASALATVALLASVVAAQTQDPVPTRVRFGDPRLRLPMSMPAPAAVPSRLLGAIPLEAPPRAQSAIAPLPPGVAARVARAAALRQAGLPDRARDTLLALDRDAQRHPAVVLERVRAELVREDFATAERMARAARGRDSLLLSRELAVALDGLGRTREALEVCAQSLAASPAEGEWTAVAVTVMGSRDWRVARDVFAAAYQRSPGRAAIAWAYALPLIKLGSAAEAMRVIGPLDRAPRQQPRRLRMSEELLDMGTAADSASAFEALWSTAGDRAVDEAYRRVAARRAWELSVERGAAAAAALRFSRELADVPATRWGGDLAVAVARALRESGRVTEARAILTAAGDAASPELRLERLLAEVRDAPSPAAISGLEQLAQQWSGARFALAEAQFWAGQVDSALANYGRAAEDPASPHAGDALERSYLLEENPRHAGLRMLGRIAWEDWRGEHARAQALADSLLASLPRGDVLWAPVAVRAAERRLAAGNARGALAPLLVVADSLPGDRLASRARQLAGEAYLALGEPSRALAQFEECLARYPRAWNAAEVRRRLEALRRERRF